MMINEGDIVHFNLSGNTYEYEVGISYLIMKKYNGARSSNNKRIFEDLGISEGRIEIATESYGYQAGIGAWPESSPKDYAALTRLYDKLTEMCHESNKLVNNGAIVVRTNNYGIGKGMHGRVKGDIFKCYNSSQSEIAYYTTGSGTNYWRYATKIERDLFNSGAISNVNDTALEVNLGRISNRTLNHSIS